MENLLNRKNLIIAGVVLVIILGVLIYFGVRRGEEGERGGIFGLFPAPTPERVGAPTPAERGVGDVFPGGAGALPLSPQAANDLPVGTLLRLSSDNVVSIAPYVGTTTRYYKNIAESLGHLFERRADGIDDEKKLSNFTIPQILKVVWAPDVKRAVIFYTLEDQVRKILIDYSTTTPKTNFLPDSVADVAFSPDSKSLAFINNLGETQNIFIATADFRNPRKVFDSNIPEVELLWPSANTLSIKTKSSYAVRGFLYTIDTRNGSLTKIAEGFGLDAVWNSDGFGALYSTVTAGGGMQNLKFYDLKTQNVKEIGVKTIAEKCVFLKTQKTLAHCAVPRGKTPGVGGLQTPSVEERGQLPDAWWQGKISFQDDLFLIDVSKGETNSFVSTNLDITMPKVLSNDSWMLFRDKSTGNLWGLKLKP